MRVEVATLVVKVASRCNLNCDYCYMYHGEDRTWEAMPKRMGDEVADALVMRIAELGNLQGLLPQIVLHGGW
jgi:uncharacterized protein